MEFRWNAWNVEHIARHGIGPAEAQYIVGRARGSLRRERGDGKYLAMG
jgi:hypothetical protein